MVSCVYEFCFVGPNPEFLSLDVNLTNGTKLRFTLQKGVGLSEAWQLTCIEKRREKCLIYWQSTIKNIVSCFSF